jgi:hypothetical protein
MTSGPIHIIHAPRLGTVEPPMPADATVSTASDAGSTSPPPDPPAASGASRSSNRLTTKLSAGPARLHPHLANLPRRPRVPLPTFMALAAPVSNHHEPPHITKPATATYDNSAREAKRYKDNGAQEHDVGDPGHVGGHGGVWEEGAVWEDALVWEAALVWQARDVCEAVLVWEAGGVGDRGDVWEEPGRPPRAIAIGSMPQSGRTRHLPHLRAGARHHTPWTLAVDGWRGDGTPLPCGRPHALRPTPHARSLPTQVDVMSIGDCTTTNDVRATTSETAAPGRPLLS